MRIYSRTVLEVLGGGMDELEGDELEATLLEALDDLSNESTLDAVGLHVEPSQNYDPRRDPSRLIVTLIMI